MVAVFTLLLLLAGPLCAEEIPATLYVFVQEGCPACAEMKSFVAELPADLPGLDVEIIETRDRLDNILRLSRAAEKFGLSNVTVPAVFMGSHSWVGYGDTIVREITVVARECVETGCGDALGDQPLERSEREAAAGGASAGSAEVSTSIFGTVSLGRLPLIVATALVALLDGVNPCSLWALTFLLGMVLHLGSRRRIILVGLVFLVTTAAVYGLFIVGVVQVVSIMARLTWIRVAIALVALAMGVINVKDYFAFKKGVSLTLSREDQGSFAQRARRLLSVGDRPGPLVFGTVSLAAGVAVVELPCTAGFPVIWSNMVTSAGVATGTFYLLLAVYLAVYLLDELIVVFGATFALRRIVITERRGRVLKLVGGTVMVALAAVLAFAPDLMDSLPAVIAVFGGAVAVAALVAVVHRRFDGEPQREPK